jgi:phosphatidylethanolamine/phosphatidyl-N-methylethanolamine N-methyltransferase
MNNGWNRIIYKCWAPIYDRFFNSGIFLKARNQIFNDLSIKKGSKILFIGVGTGADLPFFLNKGFDITAIDYSAEMLKVAREKYGDYQIKFLEMDAQKLHFQDETFDFIVASLILSVVPHPEKAYSELNRVLADNGQFLIFDKFVPKNKKMSVGQKMIRPLIKFLGTDIGVDFYQVHNSISHPATILQDENVMLNGLYRKLIGVKTEETI